MTKMLILVAFAAACGNDKPSSAADVKQTAAPAITRADTVAEPTAIADAAPSPAPEAPIVITAGKLFADYSANEIGADDKYKGKLVEVTGIIDRIAKDVLGNPYVLLAAARFQNVQALFGDDERVLGKLKKGEKLVLKCRGDGSALGIPMLKDCEIEHIFEWSPAK